MEPGDAWELLGIPACTDRSTIRESYLRRVRDEHPDRSGSPDAHDRTILLGVAYRTALEQVGDTTAPLPTSPPADVVAPHDEVVPVAQLDDDTLGVGAPPDETWRLLIDAAHRLGEISFIDAAAGLAQVIVEFVDEPVCQIVLSLQGRATGVTEVFLTVESLDGSPAPPVDAVTRLLLTTLME